MSMAAWRVGLRRVLRCNLVIGGLTGGALLRPLAIPLAPWDWRADLLTVFAMPAIAAAVLAALCWMSRRRRAVAVTLLLLAIGQTIPLFRYSGANPVLPDPARPERLRLLLLNVYQDNSRFEDVARLIEVEQPDIVGLVEFTDFWAEGLERTGIQKQYPYRREYPFGFKGLALWSRIEPLAMGGPETARPDGNPYLTMTFEFAGKERRLWLLHAPNPLYHWPRATPDLLALGDRIGKSDGSNIVLGDLNRTDGSPHFSAFARAIGLRDSRLGFGLQPSWPVWSPYRVAIDHVFLPEDLAVAERRLGPDIGSDHRPVLIDLAVSRRAATAGRHESAGSSRSANRTWSVSRRNASS